VVGPKKVNGWGFAVDPLASYTVDDAGCWIWQRAMNHDGYGQLSGGKKSEGTFTSVKAHRWFYEHFVGPIPEGMTIDHLCCVRACVNPDHLEVVTHAENCRRAAARRTHCSHGHEYTAENTRIDSGGQRRCRTCASAHTRKWNAIRRLQRKRVAA
jgi:hypothetical protein